MNAPEAAELVELHFYRVDQTSAFLVVVPDDALLVLNKGHAMRGLTITFNGMGKKSTRLFQLAKAVKEAEDAGAVKADEKPPGRIRRASRAVCRWIVALVYPVVRLFNVDENGGAS